nr:TIGR02466 family protein [uncultured Albidiferax sp.]
MKGFHENDIRIQRLFATPLASIAVPEASTLNAQLSHTILERARSHPSHHHSNLGGWQSADDFFSWDTPAAQSLKDFAVKMANSLTAVSSPQGLLESNVEWRVNAWANVNYPGSANALHGHPGAFWSGIYWVDDGGRNSDPTVEGDLEFMDPRGLLPSVYAPSLRFKIEGCLSAGYSETIAPASGTLVMFPAWLLHAVRVFKGQRPRISVAFNFAH